jgi:hypothetical protein
MFSISNVLLASMTQGRSIKAKYVDASTGGPFDLYEADHGILIFLLEKMARMRTKS